MRVVGGRWRGRKIGEPKGSDVTRPTTDRVREACASMVLSALEDGIEGARVLDAFAGSGALGIEMLSRGAASAVFFDADRAAAALVRSNLASLGAERDIWRVVRGDVVAHAERGRIPAGPFDLVLLDPPYAFDIAVTERLLEALVAHGALRPGALVLHEHAASAPGARPSAFTVVREKRYGITAVDLIRYTPNHDS